MSCSDTLQPYSAACQPFSEGHPNVESAFMWKTNRIMSSLEGFFGVSPGLLCNVRKTFS